MIKEFRNSFKKSFLLIGLFISLLAIGFVKPVTAAVDVLDCSDPEVAQTDFCKGKAAENRDLLGADGIITSVIQLIVYMTGAISVIMVVIGGFRYVLSGGDSNATAGAKNTIMYALIGVVVAIFAQAIVSLVLSKL